MRAPISEDCTGEPPGELISRATATGLPRLNAFSRIGANAASVSEARPAIPIVPLIRTTDTIGGFLIKGSRNIMNTDVDWRLPLNKV